MAHTSGLMNLIMVASALPGDGKTFTCINLALSMAMEKDTSVLLVDTDVAKPDISRLFGIDNEPGLVDLLIDTDRSLDEVTLSTDVPSLQILSAGRRDEYATELFASKRMAVIITQMANEYPERIVIFDSPPLQATSEAHVLASLVGQIALVVCADQTPRPAVLESITCLDDSKAINLILNQAGSSFSLLDYGGYGYGAKYGHGGEGENGRNT
jgi:exopolysaccharide/PEP-CTERM locus tyrosine autokinase